MKLVVFIGSPRLEKSNSLILAGHFLEGYRRVEPLEVPVYFLADLKQMEANCKAFQEAEAVLIFFPMSTESLPGVVKLFFEKLESVKKHPQKKLGFLLQAGSPESLHGLALESYLKKLSLRLQCRYLGTIISRCPEDSQMMPSPMTRKLFASLESLGGYFASNRAFDPRILHAQQQPCRMSRPKQAFMRLLGYTGLNNFYWDLNLKRHKAFQRRFDKPFN